MEKLRVTTHLETSGNASTVVREKLRVTTHLETTGNASTVVREKLRVTTHLETTGNASTVVREKSGTTVISFLQFNHQLRRSKLEVDRISAPNVDIWALSADIRFRPKAVVSHSVHFRFRRAAVGKFGGCRK